MPEQQQRSGSDNSLDFLWVVALLVGVTFIGWNLGKVYITTAIFYVRLYEIIAIDFVFHFFTKFIKLLGFQVSLIDFNDWIDYLRHQIGSAVEFGDIIKISTLVGNYLRYPLMLIVGGGAAWLYFGSATHRFRHTFTTKLLKTVEQQNWSQVTPVVNLDLVKTKLDEGGWAIALSPLHFCKKLNLLDIKEQHGRYRVTLRRGAAYRVLSLQVGPKWYGAATLPIHLKALFTIFAARINADKAAAEALLDQISASAAGSKLNFNNVEALLRKYGNTKKVNKIVANHGYVATVLASMLVGAREVGVLASSEFIWLKPLDRRMWYMLNSVGRPTAVAEICGAFAHWLAEKKLGFPLVVPTIEEGIKGLEIALSEIIYKPDEE